MRLPSICVALLVLAGCASSDERIARDIEKQYVVTYYDRNKDGVVDLEFHDIPGAADAAWARVDTKFRGRYDLAIHWSVGVTREGVDIPVPHDVHITPGRPPVRESDLHFKRPNQAMQRTALALRFNPYGS